MSLRKLTGAEDCRVIGSELIGVACEGVPVLGSPLRAFRSHAALVGGAGAGAGAPADCDNS